MVNVTTAHSRKAVVRVPVSLTSASNQFAFPDELKGVSNLHFTMENTTPHDIRLEGTTSTALASGGFIAVTDATGWICRAGESSGPWVSKMPVFLSAKVVSTTGNPVPASTDFTGCFLDLIYTQRV
jgi:hypothetical protein